MSIGAQSTTQLWRADPLTPRLSIHALQTRMWTKRELLMGIAAAECLSGYVVSEILCNVTISVIE